MRIDPQHVLVGLALAVLATSTGCKCSPPSSAADSGSSGADGGPNFTGTLVITPSSTTLEVETGQLLPSQQFAATADGKAVSPTWAALPTGLGSIDSSGVFYASGAAGIATVTATYGSASATATVTIHATLTQNGGTADAGTAGAGGVGGVGGEGEGGPVTPAIGTVLSGTPSTLQGLTLLYPYDGTVWPRGLLPPLLQWTPGGQSFEAVSIELQCSTIAWRGTFAKTATPFIHHPIPRAAWQQVTDACADQSVTLRVVLATASQAYGPLTATWRIAPGALKGIVYYNSYGTKLAINDVGGLFGGATLGIKGSSTDPVLVAGSSGGEAQCRVCHVVSADGSTLISQHGENYKTTSAYALKNGNAETTMMPLGDGRFAWGGLSPDGTRLFSNSADKMAGASSAPSALFQVPSGATLATTGLPSGLRAATPVFSPDGKALAFNFFGGSTGSATGDQRSLAMMPFSTPGTFGALAVLLTPPAGQTAVYPTFLPSSTGVVFELETRSNGRSLSFGETRGDCDRGTCNGARGELWWVDVATKKAARLDRLNGSGGLLPGGANGHEDDSTLNYEPTVGPIPSGGYAWVIFTSRRMYGNVANINPYWSDPRYHDIATTPTPKKLWVAAIDLNPAPGSDPSHPAFYLPAQELLAGNSRGYWSLEPCLQDGASCESGDQCCGGYCRGDGELTQVCGSSGPGCSREFEHCTVSADCCHPESGTYCENGRCVVAQIQ